MTQAHLSTLLLNWYEKQGRDLPWRVRGGAHPDPYVILVSEFMLQQTGVKTVIPYFHRFMEHFPTIQSLAQTSLEDVYFYWQGLGYYSRARSLHSTAKIIAENFSGEFPKQRSEVLKLKGIGPYTASSFLALAFNQPETVIDGNVIRVICRMYHLAKPITEIMNIIQEKAEALTDKKHPADYASAIMDLGAMVCTPQNPQCLICPWQKDCLSQGDPHLKEIPSRHKLEKKTKYGKVYLIYNNAGEIFIRKRIEKGLLSGLYEFPWNEEEELFQDHNPQDTGKEVSHTFTHFKLTLKIYTLQAEQLLLEGQFVSPSTLENYPISTLMKKVYNKLKNN